MNLSEKAIHILGKIHIIDRRIQRYSRTPEQWEYIYQKRTERLGKLIAMNAPRVIIDRECRMVRLAVHKSGPVRVVWDDFIYWLKFLWIKWKLRNEDVEKWADEVAGPEK